MVNLDGFPLLMTVCLFLVSTTILTWCFCMDSMFWVGIGVLIVAVRTSGVVSWRNLPYPRWRMAPEVKDADEVVIILIYVDSYLFVCSTSILQVGVGLSNNHASCEYRSLPRGKF